MLRATAPCSILTGSQPRWSLNRQLYPSIAWDGENYLVVWTDFRAGSYLADIYASRVTPSGEMLDGAGIPIATTTNFEDFPDVAWNGENYLVVWDRWVSSYVSQIYGARVTAGGQVLDPGGIVISQGPSQFAPAVSASSDNFLVVWERDEQAVYGARVSPSGVVLDPQGIVIDPVSDRSAWPDVAWNGTNFFAVWAREDPGQDKDVYGARISPSGTVLDPAGIAVATGFDRQDRAKIAWGNSSYLVVWNDYNDGVVASRVGGDGQVFDRDGISLGPNGWAGAPAGTAQRSSSPGSSGPRRATSGLRVTGAGNVVDEHPHPIALSTTDEYSAQATGGPAGEVAVLDSRLATERRYGAVERSFLRFVDAGSPAPEPTRYAVSTQSGQSLIVGTEDIGNHCEDCLTPIRFPFPVRLFGETYDSAILGADGVIQFESDTWNFTNACPLPHEQHRRAFFVHWDDLTTAGPGHGIFTAVVGAPPSRRFVIEWRAAYEPGTGNANFEAVFDEQSGAVRTIFGDVTGGGASSTEGIGSTGHGPAFPYACNQPGSISDGLSVIYMPQPLPPPPPPPPPRRPRRLRRTRSTTSTTTPARPRRVPRLRRGLRRLRRRGRGRLRRACGYDVVRERRRRPGRLHGRQRDRPTR